MGTTECALPQQRSSRDGIWRCRGVLPLHVSRAVINLEVETVLADWKRFVGGVLLLVVILGFCVLTVAGTATANSEREYVEKAAYLYNFTKFINWPEAVFSSARDPIEICVLGRDDFGGSLEALVSGKRVRGRYLVVRKLRGGGPGDSEAASCNILFVSESEKGREPSIFAAIEGRSVVTVGEVDGFAKNGGMINCIVRGTKPTFQLNRKAAEESDIIVSSHLVKLAELID